MNERVMKAAIEYIAHECSANMQMLECNPRTAITIAECQRLMVGFSAQERNKAIDECAKLAREYKALIFLGENFAEKLESLKK